MNIAILFISIILFILIGVLLLTLLASYKQLKFVENVADKQTEVMFILMNSRINKEPYYNTLEKIEKVLVTDSESSN